MIRWITICVIGIACLSGCQSEISSPNSAANENDEATKAPTRMVDLEKQSNFRDLGGYTTSDGRKVKFGEVYRSGRLSELTDADVERLAELELASVVNFLTEGELKTAGEDRLPPGVELVRMPMNTGSLGDLAAKANHARLTGDFSEVPPDLNAEIHRILVEEGKEYYSELLKRVGDSEQRPLVFHCSHGVHRAGTGAAILLAALGVPWEQIREDYLLSNVARHEEIERRVEELVELAAKNQSVAPSEIDRTNIEAFYILQGSYIDAALTTIKEKYGSMEGYLKEGLGMTDADLENLRDSLLETP